MNHKIRGRKLNRKSSHRKAMLMNLTNSLIEHERIKTTLAKAKELRPFAEKIITFGKKGSLHCHRKIISVLRNKEIVKRLVSEISPRYKNRNGGYTRIMKCGFRTGDSAPMAIIELVDRKEKKLVDTGRKSTVDDVKTKKTATRK